MSLIDFAFERQSNPVDMIEVVAASNDWTFERSGEDEIAMTVEGRWADYHVSFSWMEDFEALHLACAFSIKIPDIRWRQEDVVIFRQSLLLAGGAEPTNQQVEVLLSSALEACETYFQAFQFVVWSGLDAKSAMDAVLFETVGEA